MSSDSSVILLALADRRRKVADTLPLTLLAGMILRTSRTRSPMY